MEDPLRPNMSNHLAHRRRVGDIRDDATSPSRSDLTDVRAQDPADVMAGAQRANEVFADEARGPGNEYPHGRGD